MPQVLTTNARIVCPHMGQGTTTPSSTKWSVNGGMVLLENDSGVLACPFVPYPCIGYRLQSMGLNATQIDGRKVIMTSDFNQSFTGLPLLMTETHTTIDNSTPAPIPAGQPAPPLSPALLDSVAPVVIGIPPVLAFNTVTMQPATLATTFTLTSVHPMKWIATLINEPLRSHTDVTNGLSPGLVVTPAGGAWNSSPLVVTLTMTATFMLALTPGLHHFYMIGVNQRGLSGFFKVVLTVS